MSEFSDARYRRAVSELSSYSFKRIAGTRGVAVRKQTAPKAVPYVVSPTGCTCHDFTTRGLAAGEPCKHMIMVGLTPLGEIFRARLPEPPAAPSEQSGPRMVSPAKAREIENEAWRLMKEHNALWEDNKTDPLEFKRAAVASLQKKAYRRAWFEEHTSAWEELNG